MGHAAKSDEFSEMFHRGRGLFSIQRFWGFLSMKWIQTSNVRVQIMFNSTIVLKKIKTIHTLKKELLNPPPLDLFRKFIHFGGAPTCLKEP